MNDAIFFSDDDDEKVDAFLEYILVERSHIFQEGDAGADTRAPTIREDGVWVEGVRVIEESGDSTPASERLLMWAAMFPIFSQKIPGTSAQNAVIVITEEIFKKKAGKSLRNRAVDRLGKILSKAK